MNYQHQFIDGSIPVLPIGKVVCVGRNYAEHARELNNPLPTMPLLFIKPATALWVMAQPIRLPTYSQECHYELEVAVLIGSKLKQASLEQVKNAIIGYGLALDLTLRDIQQQLKQQGHPWERAKAFDGSCPMSPFIKSAAVANPQQFDFSLSINGEIKQHGQTQDMLWPIDELIAHISNYFTLLPGDVVLTGTPAGVGPLRPGDKLELKLAQEYQFNIQVAS